MEVVEPLTYTSIGQWVEPIFWPTEMRFLVRSGDQSLAQEKSANAATNNYLSIIDQ